MAALLLAVLATPLALAQGGGVIYPDLDGDALTAALAAAYAPTTIYGYDRARDTLFAAVYLERADATGAVDDSLRGLYSGHAVALAPPLDPTAAAWASSPRFSTEHVWPQSRGAADGTSAHSDMHHLAPVMQSVNSSRSDHPFAEIPDAQADRWWGPDGVTRTAPPPTATRDRYTEKRNGAGAALEPRESVAGDVARAAFYVWAVYGPSGADHLDADFWAAQRDALLDWHAQDPPDDAETARTLAVARHQGTPNPFVLDATLAERAFGPPPVVATLGTFTAAQAGDGLAAITWTTTAESGGATFHVDGRPDAFGAAWAAWDRTDASGAPSSYGLTVPDLAVGVYRVRLRALTASCDDVTLGEIGLSMTAPTDGDDGPDAQIFALTVPAPNPASGAATVTLSLTQATAVLAVVYDALGREALVAYDGVAVGETQIRIDTSALAPGVYHLRAVALDGSATPARRFTVAR